MWHAFHQKPSKASSLCPCLCVCEHLSTARRTTTHFWEHCLVSGSGGGRMLYSQFLLSRKGPLSTIWAAAFFFRKLKREEIAHTDISSSIDKIIPDTEISYRVLAQLLLGIVRIFSKKVDYLYSDCNEALSSIRKSFSPGKFNVRKKTIMKPERSIKTTKEHRRSRNVVHLKEAISMEPEDPMWGPCEHITISIPERFELDSFVLDIPDDEDAVRPHTESSPLDILLDDSNRAPFINESFAGGRFSNEDFTSACFTPVNDVLPYEIMDIEFEITGDHNLSTTDKGEECIQGDEECVDKDMEKESGVVNMVDGEPRDLLEPVKLMTARTDLEKRLKGDLMSDVLNHEDLLDTVVGQNQMVKLAQIINESPSRNDIEIPSPQPTVRTPARKEQQRCLPKKRRSFDEAIVLSNKIVRTGIHDASSLILKRRKAPHTHLDAWRAKRICSMHENIFGPLIPCLSSKVQSFSESKFSRYSVEVSADHHVELAVTCAGKPVEVEQLCNEEPMPRIIEDLIPESHYEDSRTHNLYEKDAEKSLSVEHSETESDSDNQDFGSFNGVRRGDGWSSRTRNVAKFLLNKFTDPQNQKGSLSLDVVLQGKTRAKCARLFYETLILKGGECIDVEQDSPYSDIVISATSKLRTAFESR